MSLFEDDVPLSQILLDQVKNLGKYVYSMIPAPPEPIIKAKFFVKQQIFVYYLKKKYPKNGFNYTAKLSRLFRRNRARLLRERAHKQRRFDSALKIQRLVRKFFWVVITQRCT